MRMSFQHWWTMPSTKVLRRSDYARKDDAAILATSIRSAILISSSARQGWGSGPASALGDNGAQLGWIEMRQKIWNDLRSILAVRVHNDGARARPVRCHVTKPASDGCLVSHIMGQSQNDTGPPAID